MTAAHRLASWPHRESEIRLGGERGQWELHICLLLLNVSSFAFSLFTSLILLSGVDGGEKGGREKKEAA